MSKISGRTLVGVWLLSLCSGVLAQEPIAVLADQILAQRPSMVGRSFINPNSVISGLEDEYKMAREKWGADSLQTIEAQMMLGHATIDAWDQRKIYKRALATTERLIGRDHKLYGRYVLEAAAGLINYAAYRRQEDYLEQAERFFSARAPSIEYAQIEFIRGFLHEGNNDFDLAAGSFSASAQRALPLADRHDEARELAKSSHLQVVRIVDVHPDAGDGGEHCRALTRLVATDGNASPEQVLLVPPEYPRLMLIEGQEGAVTFTFSVDTQGRVGKVKVESVEGPPVFGEALLEVIERWRFSPRMKDGEIVTSRLRNRYLFTGEEAE